MKADDVHYNLVGCNDIILEEKRKRRKYRKTINKPTATTQQRLDQISTSAHTVLKLYQKGINDVWWGGKWRKGKKNMWKITPRKENYNTHSIEITGRDILFL